MVREMNRIIILLHCFLQLLLQFHEKQVLSFKIRHVTVANPKFIITLHNHGLYMSSHRRQNDFLSSTSLFQSLSDSEAIESTVESVNEANNPIKANDVKVDEKETITYTPKKNTKWNSFLFSWFKPSKEFSKESLAKLGLNVLLAYGFISNLAYITCFIIAWVLHGKTYGLSPLAPGSWKSFLLIYSGFVAVNNLIRPLRYGVSLAISPLFSKLVDAVEQRTGYKRATATSIVVFMVNIVGSTSYMSLGLLIATRIFGVPLFPPRVTA